MKIVLVLGFGLTFPNKTEDDNEDEKLQAEASTLFMLCGAPQKHGRLLSYLAGGLFPSWR